MKTRLSWRSTRALMLAMPIAALFLFSCTRPKIELDIKLISINLKQQADQWDQAIIRKDNDAIAGNMSNDFRHIGRTGEISNKETFLREINSPDLVIDPYIVEDFDIRIYGGCALLCGRTRMTGTYKGKPFQSHYRFIDTYRRDNGQWKVCNVQITSILE